MGGNVVEPVENSESNPPKTSRGLLAAVIIMGVMIVIGTVMLVWVIAHRMAHKSSAHNTASPVVMTHIEQGDAGLLEPALLSIPRREGESVSAVTARPDGSVAVTLQDHKGSARVLIWAPEQARLIAELDLNTQSH